MRGLGGPPSLTTRLLALTKAAGTCSSTRTCQQGRRWPAAGLADASTPGPQRPCPGWAWWARQCSRWRLGPAGSCWLAPSAQPAAGQRLQAVRPPPLLAGSCCWAPGPLQAPQPAGPGLQAQAACQDDTCWASMLQQRRHRAAPVGRMEARMGLAWSAASAGRQLGLGGEAGTCRGARTCHHDPQVASCGARGRQHTSGVSSAGAPVRTEMRTTAASCLSDCLALVGPTGAAGSMAGAAGTSCSCAAGVLLTPLGGAAWAIASSSARAAAAAPCWPQATGRLLLGGPAARVSACRGAQACVQGLGTASCGAYARQHTSVGCAGAASSCVAACVAVACWARSAAGAGCGGAISKLYVGVVLHLGGHAGQREVVQALTAILAHGMG